MRLITVPGCATLMGMSAFAQAHGLLEGDAHARAPAILTAAALGGLWLTYLIGARRTPSSLRKQGLFHGTAVLAALTLLGPLDTWAKTGTAPHMVQHMLLMVVIPPLWVLAAPLPQLRAGAGDRLRLFWVGPLRAARLPMTMAVLHGIAIWFWHAPTPYMIAVENPWWHAVEHACFLVTAGLFWWSVLHAAPTTRGRALAALLVTLMHTGLLGALLTFANTPVYGEANDLRDQQLAGMVMWVPGGMAYLAAAAWCTWRWLARLARRA